jgi:hypothetical protein
MDDSNNNELFLKYDEELDAGYSSIIWIIESNGRVINYKQFVFPMSDRWGLKCYPFENKGIK